MDCDRGEARGVAGDSNFELQIWPSEFLWREVGALNLKLDMWETCMISIHSVKMYLPWKFMDYHDISRHLHSVSEREIYLKSLSSTLYVCEENLASRGQTLLPSFCLWNWNASMRKSRLRLSRPRYGARARKWSKQRPNQPLLHRPSISGLSQLFPFQHFAWLLNEFTNLKSRL